jgi:hypothetical protein
LSHALAPTRDIGLLTIAGIFSHLARTIPESEMMVMPVRVGCPPISVPATVFVSPHSEETTVKHTRYAEAQIVDSLAQAVRG